jgi:hypothetical protein
MSFYTDRSNGFDYQLFGTITSSPILTIPSTETYWKNRALNSEKMYNELLLTNKKLLLANESLLQTVKDFLDSQKAEIDELKKTLDVNNTYKQ